MHTNQAESVGLLKKSESMIRALLGVNPEFDKNVRNILFTNFCKEAELLYETKELIDFIHCEIELFLDEMKKIPTI